MLSKAIRSISRIEALETVENKTYSGEATVDRKMNINIGKTLVRGTEIRYIILSDEETERILKTLKRETNSTL